MAAYLKRSWSIILQQAWTLRLKDKIRFGEGNSRSGYTTPGRSDDGWGNLCKRFNKGRCTFGPGCRFEHHCKYCKKFGHGIHVCCKLKFDKAQNGGSSRNRNPSAQGGAARQESVVAQESNKTN